PAQPTSWPLGPRPGAPAPRRRLPGGRRLRLGGYVAGQMTQTAPFPQALASVVERLSYRPGWSFRLAVIERSVGVRGLHLIISVDTVDAYHPERPYTVTHNLAVPIESHDEASWTRWVFDRIGDVEMHERMEAFQVGGVRPFAPGHGGGHDPYHA